MSQCSYFDVWFSQFSLTNVHKGGLKHHCYFTIHTIEQSLPPSLPPWQKPDQDKTLDGLYGCTCTRCKYHMVCIAYMNEGRHFLNKQYIFIFYCVQVYSPSTKYIYINLVESDPKMTTENLLPLCSFSCSDLPSPLATDLWHCIPCFTTKSINQ